MFRTLLILSLLLIAACQASPFTPGELIVMGRDAAREQNWALAERHYLQALEADPEEPFALYNLSILYRNTGRPAEEERVLARLMDSGMFPGAALAVDNDVEQRRRAAGRRPLREMIMDRWMDRGGYRDEALALTPNLERGRETYFQFCSRKCHLPNAWGTPDGKYPQIAGQFRRVQIKQLADIRARNRDNPTMFRFSIPTEIGGVQAIADVSAYIASLPMSPENGRGPGTHLEEGAQLYAQYCRYCHGVRGEGNPRDYYPMIQGQHYAYMVRQFDWILTGKRRNVHPLKVRQLQALNQEQISAVLDYVSRIEPPSVLVAASGWVNPDAEGREAAESPGEELEGQGLF